MNDAPKTPTGMDEPARHESSSPGQRLRRAREARQLEIIQVASELHVRPQLLEDLEADDVQAFSAAVYARGLMRSYARFLDIDPEPLLLLFEEMVRLDEPPLDSVTKLGPGKKTAAAESGIRYLLPIGGLLIVLIGFLVYQLVDDGDDSSADVSPVTQTQESAPEAPMRPSKNAAAAGEVSSAAEEKSAPVADGGREQTRSDRTPLPADVSEPVSSSSVTAAPARPEIDEVPAPAEDTLLLRFDADSWVEVRDGGGRRLLSRTGRAGQQMRLQGPPPFDIRLGYAPGVQLEYNGAPFKIPAAKDSRVAHFKVGGS